MPNAAILTIAGALSAALTGHTITDSAVGAACSATFAMGNNGVASWATINNGSGNFSPEWQPSGSVSAYEVRWTNTSGTPSSGTTGSWLNLGTTRSWTVNQAVAGTKSCTGTVEIRDATTGIVLASASITITAQFI